MISAWTMVIIMFSSLATRVEMTSPTIFSGMLATAAILTRFPCFPWISRFHECTIWPKLRLPVVDSELWQPVAYLKLFWKAPLSYGARWTNKLIISTRYSLLNQELLYQMPLLVCHFLMNENGTKQYITPNNSLYNPVWFPWWSERINVKVFNNVPYSALCKIPITYPVPFHDDLHYLRTRDWFTLLSLCYYTYVAGYYLVY